MREKIEEMKKKLNELVATNITLTSHKVVQLSQELDILIAEHQRTLINIR